MALVGYVAMAKSVAEKMLLKACLHEVASSPSSLPEDMTIALLYSCTTGCSAVVMPFVLLTIVALQRLSIADTSCQLSVESVVTHTYSM